MCAITHLIFWCHRNNNNKKNVKSVHIGEKKKRELNKKKGKLQYLNWKRRLFSFFSTDETDAFSIFAPHSKYICPEGHDVNLTCSIRGHRIHQHDLLTVHWVLTKDRNQNCTEEKHAKNTTDNHHQKAHKGSHFSNGLFYRTLFNVTQADDGGYCCFLYETDKKHLMHQAHSYMELQVKTGKVFAFLEV